MINKIELDKILNKVDKPARYIGGEQNSIIKEEGTLSNQFQTRFVFAFPDIYEIGMSYLGLQIIYKVLNETNGVFCERAFVPWDDMATELTNNNIPLFTLETKTEVNKADILGITLQYELSYTNILNILELSKIPFKASDRDESFPFVAGGGPCAYNPEPLWEIFDFFMIGDGEILLVEVVKEHLEWKKAREPKIEFLKRISKLDGVYVPSFYDINYDEFGIITNIDKKFPEMPNRIKKRIEPDLDVLSFPTNPIVPFIETVHNRASIEIFRGCSRGCRFCQAGIIYRPVRERSKEKIKNYAMEQIKNTGFDEMSILSLSSSDYSEFEVLALDLMKSCKEQDVSLSLPSLRLDSISVNVLDELMKYKRTGLTYAPEAGTMRLRNVINKSITDQDIDFGIEQAVSRGWNNIKLYFMVGLPTETDEDLDGIVEIAKRAKDISNKYSQKGGSRFNVTVSVSNFVPKPHTPFQWFPQCTLEEFKRKHYYIKDQLKNLKFVTYNYHGADSALLEAVFARGDRRLSNVIIEAYKNGCKFDSWREHFKFDKWMATFEELGVDPSFYATREREYDEFLPWDIIDIGVEKEFLIRENEQAKKVVQTPNCRDMCSSCGLSDNFECKLRQGE
jgi:radical SAM family uncharacterized protein